MDFAELYRKAMGPKGLSANFDGQTQKQETEMGKLIENKAYGLVIKNDTAEDVCFALMPGAFTSLEELQKRFPQVKAILKDGKFHTSDNKDVTCTCRNGSTVDLFHSYFKSVTGVVTTLDMTSTEKENFYTEVEVGTPNPCVVESLKRVALSDYLGTQQYDQNRVIAKNINIPLSAIHMVLLTIKAGSTVTYTMSVNTQL